MENFQENLHYHSIDCLEVCVETYFKCITFDFDPNLLNEAMDEPFSINVSQILKIP